MVNLSPPAKESDNAVVFYNQVPNEYGSFSNGDSSTDFVSWIDSSIPQQSFGHPTKFFYTGDTPHQWHNKQSSKKSKWHNNFKHPSRCIVAYVGTQTSNIMINYRFCGRMGHYMRDCHQFLSIINHSPEPDNSNSNRNWCTMSKTEEI